MKQANGSKCSSSDAGTAEKPPPYPGGKSKPGEERSDTGKVLGQHGSKKQRSAVEDINERLR